jgi:hypothetical protein
MSKPEKKFKCGPISASIWSESKTVDGEMVKFHSINITKAYKEGDNWKNTNNFNAEDLPKVALVANEAYKYIRLRSTNSDE